MEWVVYESSHSFVADGSNDDLYANIDGVVTITLKTGSENMRVNLAYTYCGKTYGFGSEEYPGEGVIASKVMEIGDMENDMVDYTAAPAVSTTPSAFGWGDIFAVNFREQNSSLKDTEAVYLQAKVVYDGGLERTVYGATDKNLMENTEGDLWQKYIYPLDYFDLPAGTQIERVEVYMTDATQTVTVKDPAAMDFIILEDAGE
jgi:hypothetical protein